MTNGTAGFNPRPSNFMGVLAWAATEARLRGVPFCPLAGERVGGCAVEWLSRSFDAMSPTHKFDVEVTDLAKGTHTTFAVIRKQRTYRATGRTTVRYNTPVGNFSTFDEVNAALVAEALAAAAARAEDEGEVAEVEEVQEAEVQVDVLAAPERHEQPQQRHYAGAVAEAAPERAAPLNGSGTYLSELHLPVPAVVAYAYPPRPSRYESGGQGGYHIELGAALTHGRIRRKAGDTLCGKTFWGLDTRDSRYAVTCKRCLEIAGRFTAPDSNPQQHQQPEQQQMTQMLATMVRCEECEGEGSALYDVGREHDGTPIDARLTCEACHGAGEVPTMCPECKREGIALVVSDWDAGHRWCLHCALDAMEEGDGYTAAQVAEIQAQAVAAGILMLPEQHTQVEQQQAQALAVAVAGFEPECDRCGALLDERGRCPVCAPRWRACETGVRHAQTIPISRHAAYAEHVKADAAAQAGRKEGAGPARQRRLDEASQNAWTAFKRWRDADNFAARAGAHDHLRWADL